MPRQNMVRNFLLTEIVARVLKNDIRERMRKLKSSMEADYVKAIVDHLNFIFSSGMKPIEFLLPAYRF